MAAVAVIDLTAGPGVGFLPLIALGPAFAGLAGSMRRTGAISVLAMGLCLTLGLYNGQFGDRRGSTALLGVAGVSAAGLLATAGRKRREAELASVRSIAEVAQRVLLRPVPLSVGPLRIAVSYTSAVAEARIGGDLYEVVTSPRGVRVIVGDVQGKGLEAVETAAVVLGAFREAAYDEVDLVTVGARLERALGRHLSDEKFVTAVLAELSDDTATLLDFGHPPPLLVRHDGGVEYVEVPDPAPPLGLGSLAKEEPLPYAQPFAPGDQLLFYTDGVTEARDPDNRFYPLAERAGLLKDPNPQTALDAIREDLVAHVERPLRDDAAMLLLRHRTRGDVCSPRA
ncbi:serine/threonine-protein phosphatase [Streptomyces sp. RKND-216]|uniref:PP2C family protein-serine/threonine phosphatase n=1 Tax=Streptomyces sp. RKND-216 TaxID=2562581 RepID=UPI00109DCA39|nr:PP2C family protein-serine/threonine phosphatase [Streptomyces sp. RKND-216]THA27751.1 serine/threonine-protein phosphatase [Streptomyces sp. RKND-216]